MSVTVAIDENQGVRIVEDHIEPVPPDRIGFTIEGRMSMTEQLLGRFEGQTLEPSRIRLAVDETTTVEIDLTGKASLRLSSTDVGIESPGVDDLSRGLDACQSSIADPTEATDPRPAILAFTVDGSVVDVPEETLEVVSVTEPSVEALTFSVDDAMKSDGGVPDDVVLELSLLGYGISVHRDGTISVGVLGGSAGLGRR
ncbi:hypothetical protein CHINAEXTREME_10920 [Halobiforma lacisalsi AJ5]|nr:hypothetical protein [Halobiforma lacisalsi]APW98270.1 hypothetical protein CHINAEXTREME_10920 [Halobiforma lacisalsi AJ5]